MPAKDAPSRLIDAISSLKRAAFIENIPHMPDRWKDGECIVLTNSKDSCDILRNLLAQAFSGQGPKFEVMEQDEYDIYQIKFPASENACQILAEQVQNLTKTLIAPDHKRSR